MNLLKGHRFQRSPLSPGVPLEGSDTVLGLRQIDHLRRADALKQVLGFSGDGRQHYQRYKGPFLHQLTADHLRQQPKAWPEFLYAPSRPDTAGSAAYNVPVHTLMLRERMEENLVYFLVNYFTIAAAFGLHLILQHPWVLVSIAAISATSFCSRSQAAQRSREAPPAPDAQVGGQGIGSHSDVRRLLLIICAYIAFFLSGCGGALLRCLPLLAAAVLLHAALRRAPTEYRVRGGQVLGVPFRLALTLRSSGGGEGDARRLFRELHCAAAECVSSAALDTWLSLKRWSWVVWDRFMFRTA